MSGGTLCTDPTVAENLDSIPLPGVQAGTPQTFEPEQET
jgi:hypothetical protein